MGGSFFQDTIVQKMLISLKKVQEKTLPWSRDINFEDVMCIYVFALMQIYMTNSCSAAAYMVHSAKTFYVLTL